MSQRKMMSIKEVAEATGLTEHAIRQFEKQGIFKGVHVGESAKARILLEISQVWQALDQLMDNSGCVPTTQATSNKSHAAIATYFGRAVIGQRLSPHDLKLTPWT